MGDPFSSPRPTPDLEVFFADPESRSALPPNIEIETVAWTMRDDEVIPDCQPARSPSQPFGVAFPAGLLTCHNRDFYRELAEYIMAEGLFRPIYIGVRNRGDDSVRDVRLELQVDRADGIVRLIGASEYPRLPRRTRDRLDLAGRIPDVSMTDLTLTGLKERWLIEGSTQIVHAKQVFWFEEGIFIGATQSTAIRIGVIAYAEGIREPHEQQFLINAKVTQRVLRSEDVLKIAKEA